MSKWTWSEAGEPSLDIGREGFAVTPLRISDVQAWLETEDRWQQASGEQRVKIEKEETESVHRNVKRGAQFVDAFRNGEPVFGTPIWVARDLINGDKAVCRVNFNPVQGKDPRTRNVGWSTHPDYRRKGLAKATVLAVLDEFAGKVMGLRDVTAETRYDNIGSIGVLRGVGFQKTGESPAALDDYRVELRGDGMVYEYIKVLEGSVGPDGHEAGSSQAVRSSDRVSSSRS